MVRMQGKFDIFTILCLCSLTGSSPENAERRGYTEMQKEGWRGGRVPKWRSTRHVNSWRQISPQGTVPLLEWRWTDHLTDPVRSFFARCWTWAKTVTVTTNTPTMLLTMYRPDTDHIPTTYWPHNDHMPTRYQPDTDQIPTTHWPPTDHIPTTYWPHTDHLPTAFTNHVLTSYRQVNLFTITN